MATPVSSVGISKSKYGSFLVGALLISPFRMASMTVSYTHLAAVFHALGDAADLHRRQPLVLRDDVLALVTAAMILTISNVASEPFRLMIFMLVPRFFLYCSRAKKRAGTGFACSTSRAAQS